jgi:hypothetical protein
MLVAVKGIFQNGIARPTEPVNGREGQAVIITFLEESRTDDSSLPMTEEDWDALMKLAEECAIDTGIPDLAHQHDHYLYGTPKREE